MTSPVLFVVDDDAGSLGTLDGTLRRRYERDYLVIAESSPEAALGRLRELRAAGLSTLLLEREAVGGQAGSSSLIRNYLGFPRGISRRAAYCSYPREQGLTQHGIWLATSITPDFGVFCSSV